MILFELDWRSIIHCDLFNVIDRYFLTSVVIIIIIITTHFIRDFVRSFALVDQLFTRKIFILINNYKIGLTDLSVDWNLSHINAADNRSVEFSLFCTEQPVVVQLNTYYVIIIWEHSAFRVTVWLKWIRKEIPQIQRFNGSLARLLIWV